MGSLSKLLIKNNLLPKISDTESIALQAGDSWIEADIFTGKIDWETTFSEAQSSLSEEEQRFLNNEVETLCHMVNDWDIQQSRQVPEAAIDYIHQNKFLGLMISKEHGGLGFSNFAFSTILTKLASRNAYICLYVLIPNSVGPGELIESYGTNLQKDEYLPKLSDGRLVPCFALTEPNAGSDAVSIQSTGVVFSENNSLYIKLRFNKRYISMAPVANLIGLAFNLHDPDNLLGAKTDLGITCALVHRETVGVEMGNYHDPNGSVFPNGPIKGQDVVISIDDIVGGKEKAGHGWQMLMEALSGGRAISLPAQATGLTQQMLRTTVMYAKTREQFGISVAKFQGIEEVIARMMSNAFAMEAVRNMACKAIDKGQKPAVASAMIKYQHTELCRKSIMDAMDVLAGKAIMRGPKSIIGDTYRNAPIGVTVEGANILTRTLIQFGQGAIRCHPYIQKELNALIDQKDGELLKLLGKHLFMSIKNQAILTFTSITRGMFLPVKKNNFTRLQQKVSWASKRFSVIADLALLANGPNLKKRGTLSGRLGDCMTSLLYSVAILKKANDEPQSQELNDLVTWSVERYLVDFDKSLDEILLNFNVTGFNLITRYFWRYTSRLNPIGSGSLDKKAQSFTKRLQKNENQLFESLMKNLYQPEQSDNDALWALYFAYQNKEKANQILAALSAEFVAKLHAETRVSKIEALLVSQNIEGDNKQFLINYLKAVRTVIEVDEFTKDEYENYSIQTLKSDVIDAKK